jgi:ankyrin repeat protein
MNKLEIEDLIYNEYPYPLFIACKKGYLDVVKCFINMGDYIEKKDSKGNTPILIAALYGQYNIFKYLEDKGANIYETDNNGANILICAIDNCDDKYNTDKMDEFDKSNNLEYTLNYLQRKNIDISHINISRSVLNIDQISQNRYKICSHIFNKYPIFINICIHSYKKKINHHITPLLIVLSHLSHLSHLSNVSLFNYDQYGQYDQHNQHKNINTYGINNNTVNTINLTNVDYSEITHSNYFNHIFHLFIKYIITDTKINVMNMEQVQEFINTHNYCASDMSKYVLNYNNCNNCYNNLKNYI